MAYILNKRIVDGIIKEEEETAIRYKALGRIYWIPELVMAGEQEASHARLFRKIRKNL